MVLYGASGHAKVIIDILEQSGESVDFLIDDDPQIMSFMNYKVRSDIHNISLSNKRIIVSIGSNKTREIIASRLSSDFGTAIHPNSTLGRDVLVRPGTVIMAGAIVNSATRIGRHCILNTNCSVDHDCDLGDYVHISPNATLCGTISVGQGTQVGAGATVMPNVFIGKWVTVGAGAVVINDVPDHAVVVGNPAKIIKYNE